LRHGDAPRLWTNRGEEFAFLVHEAGEVWPVHVVRGKASINPAIQLIVERLIKSGLNLSDVVPADFGFNAGRPVALAFNDGADGYALHWVERFEHLFDHGRALKFEPCRLVNHHLFHGESRLFEHLANLIESGLILFGQQFRLSFGELHALQILPQFIERLFVSDEGCLLCRFHRLCLPCLEIGQQLCYLRFEFANALVFRCPRHCLIQLAPGFSGRSEDGLRDGRTVLFFHRGMWLPSGRDLAPCECRAKIKGERHSLNVSEHLGISGECRLTRKLFEHEHSKLGLLARVTRKSVSSFEHDLANRALWICVVGVICPLRPSLVILTVASLVVELRGALLLDCCRLCRLLLIRDEVVPGDLVYALPVGLGECIEFIERIGNNVVVDAQSCRTRSAVEDAVRLWIEPLRKRDDCAGFVAGDGVG